MIANLTKIFNGNFNTSIFHTLQIVGDHKKYVMDDGKDVFEICVVFFTQCTRNKSQFKKGEEWWLMDTGDFIKPLENPKEEKVTGQRWTYYFKGSGDS